MRGAFCMRLSEMSFSFFFAQNTQAVIEVVKKSLKGMKFKRLLSFTTFTTLKTFQEFPQNSLNKSLF